jgi:hypothetical protein
MLQLWTHVMLLTLSSCDTNVHKTIQSLLRCFLFKVNFKAVIHSQTPKVVANGYKFKKREGNEGVITNLNKTIKE